MSTEAARTVTLSPRRRFFRLLRRLALGSAVILGLFVAFVVYSNWQAERAWQAACAEADRLDPGWRYADIAAKLPVIPDERNSALRLLALNQRLTGGFPARMLSPQAKNEWSTNWQPADRRVSTEALADLRAYLESVKEISAEARLLADCPSGRIEPLTSPALLHKGPNAQDYFGVVKPYLYPKLVFEAEMGQFDEALVTLRSIVYASRPLADSFKLWDVLYATAIRYLASLAVERVLAQGEPSPSALDELRRAIEQDIGQPLMLNAYRGERAFVEDTMRALDEGRLSQEQVANLTASKRSWTGWAMLDQWINNVTAPGFDRADAAAHLRLRTKIIECLKASPDGSHPHPSEWAALKAQIAQRPKSTWAVANRYIDDFRVDDARFRAAVVALAAERYRQMRGQWPAQLGELVPDFLIAVPRDPQDLKPLRMARTANGIVIYSIGPDGNDDGGDIGPIAGKGRDVGIRLWDPDKRRQPHLP